MYRRIYSAAPEPVQNYLQYVYASSIYKIDLFILNQLLDRLFETLSNSDIRSKLDICDQEYSTCNEYIVSNPINIDINKEVDFNENRSDVVQFRPNSEVLYTVNPKSSLVCELADALIIPPYGVVITDTNKLPVEAMSHYDPRGSKIHGLQKTWRKYGRVRTILTLYKKNKVTIRPHAAA
jgi:hypothetical protein